ncbi:YebC/PmpR family DNA-binding transcriptional regulator [Buchnera aphidicola]|uniref:YebC/PmpR family DNA-binding transcriptional regulator n=1 Tax=Buchnera aphidicola TaxID=9 RepID=UPI00094CD5C4|nr:YebC/PmpR family DNA-binding transcriptional regulator [Buchnera aphidicola]
MAGHSKWANTKHRKKAQDIKRSKIFTKIIREITNASAQNGSNLNTNLQLRTIVAKANNYNISKDLINTAIQRGLGQDKKNIFKVVKYAGYSASGIAIIIHCVTNNSNRTVSSIRNIFTRFKGTLVNYENAQYLFSFFTTIQVDASPHTRDIVLNNLDIHSRIYSKKIKKNFLELTIKKNNVKFIKKQLLSSKIALKTMRMIITPKVLCDLDAINKTKMLDLINSLQKLKETTEIAHNAKI